MNAANKRHGKHNQVDCKPSSVPGVEQITGNDQVTEIQAGG